LKESAGKRKKIKEKSQKNKKNNAQKENFA